jgi:hypothetical protein
MIRTRVERAQRGKGADNMEVDEQRDEDTERYVSMGVDQRRRGRLGKKGRRCGDKKMTRNTRGKKDVGMSARMWGQWFIESHVEQM